MATLPELKKKSCYGCHKTDLICFECGLCEICNGNPLLSCAGACGRLCCKVEGYDCKKDCGSRWCPFCQGNVNCHGCRQNCWCVTCTGKTRIVSVSTTNDGCRQYCSSSCASKYHTRRIAGYDSVTSSDDDNDVVTSSDDDK
jgi:hypothetical protein